MLVVPGTSLIGLEVRDSLVPLPGFEVIGAGTDLDPQKTSGFKEFHELPRFDDPNFASALDALVERAGIDVVYPSNDLAIAVLASTPPARAKLVGHPERTALIAGSKRATHELFTDAGFMPARVHRDSSPYSFPLFVKPDVGHSSIGAEVIPDALDLKRRMGADQAFWEHSLVTERLPGEELTVDCFSSQGELLMVAPRTRDRTTNGVSVFTSDVELDSEIEAMAHVIANRLDFDGPWFFQVKRRADGAPRLMEIGARLAGASRIRRAQGVNLAQLAVLAAQGLKLGVSRTPAAMRSLVVDGEQRLESDVAFATLAIDFDDTLVVNGAINAPVLELMDRVRSNGHPVILITRHAGDLGAALDRLDLRESFTEIHHLIDGSSKAAIATGRGGTVLLDDSFAERRSAEGAADVLATDASAAPLLDGLFS